MNNSTLLILLVILILAIILVPLGVIWSLNLLFGLEIAYTFGTWFAALLLSGVVGGSRSSSK